MASIGRGRGRGRGLLARNTSDEALIKPGGGDAKAALISNAPVNDASKENGKLPSSITQTKARTESVNEMQAMLDNLKLDISENELTNMHKLAESAANENDDVKKLAELVYTKCVSDRDFAKTGAFICDKLATVEAEKESIRSKSVSKFLNIFSFMCQVFCTMKLGGGEVFKPLVAPLYEYISLIVDSDKVDPDEFECLNLQMQSVGKDLEHSDKEKMNSLLEKVRLKIIRNGASAQARCTLLELVECYSRNWCELPNDITRFYCDTIVDILIDASGEH